MTIPNHNLSRAALQQTVDCRIDFPDEQLAGFFKARALKGNALEF
jgi:hypothetical protein